MTKRHILTALAASALLVASTSAFAAYKAEYKLDIVPSLNTAWGMGATRFAELVKERTEGRINIKVYPNAQLTTGKQTNAFLLIRNGAIDFAVQSSINWSPQVTQLNLFALPFFISKYPDRYAAMDAITQGESGQMIIKAVEKKGVQVLCFGENGFRELTNSKMDIHTPEDFDGLKMRVVGSPLYIDTYKAVGANPVSMNWSDTMSAIQQGVIDGQENPISTFYPLRIQEYHQHLLNWHIVIDPTLFAVNPGVWKSFSPEDQKIIEQAAKDAAAYQIALARVGFDNGEAAEYLKSIGEEDKIVDWMGILEKEGVSIVDLTPEETSVFVQITEPVVKDWTEKIGPDIVNTAIKEMEAAQNK